MFVHSNCVLHLFVTEYVALAVLVREISGHTSRTNHIKKHFFFAGVTPGFAQLQIFDPTEIIEP